MKVLIRIFAGIGFVFVLGVILGIVSFFNIVDRIEKPRPLPDQAYLHLDLSGELDSGPPPDPISRLVSRRNRIEDLTLTLERAQKDDRIKGLAVDLGPISMSMAEAQELRAAVSRFREAGKFAVLHADTFGELTGADAPFVFASAFEEIWLQPGGYIGLSGFAAQPVFLADALAEIGVDAQYLTREEYKTAAETFTNSTISPANREMLESLLGDLQDQVSSTISSARAIDPGTLEQAIARAPLMAREALDIGLIDAIGYADELFAEVEGRAPEAERVSMSRYGATKRGSPLPQIGGGAKGSEADSIAVVYGSGAITRGSGEASPFESGATFAADTIAEALIEAARAPGTRAIIFRVESPGGSAIASDTVLRAVKRAQTEYETPIVVSMGSVAASGGYWVSMGADRIIAQPGTLTGSIGVVAGKFVIADLLEDLKINTATIETAPNASAASPFSAFSDAQKQRLNAIMDDIYNRFVDGVAAGRDMPRQRVEAIAGGRVWTGRQAFNQGLVDALGGLREARRAAKELAGIAAEQTVPLRVFPRRKPPLAQLQELLATGGATVQRQEALTERLQALLAVAGPYLERAAAPQTARMPDLGLQ